MLIPGARSHVAMDALQSMRNRTLFHVFLFLSLWATNPALAETYHLPLLLSATDPSRRAVMRIVNHSATEGQVLVTAIDDTGRYFGPITLTLDAQAAIEFNSTDLERGDDTLGIAPGVGDGEGDWRLLIESDLDIEPLAYVRTSTGFMDRLHDVAPRRWFYHRVALTAPDILGSPGGTLRLINRDYTEAEVVIVGQDENGDTGSRQVVLYLPAGSSRSISASELEEGASRLTGRLGDGEGDWRLTIFADSGLDIQAMTLLDQSSRALANLSTARAADGEILLFPSTADVSRRGVLTLTSRSGSGEVSISAIDEAGQEFGPVYLELEGERTVRLESYDLEFGNAAKGLPTGLGSGDGDWRLFVQSYLNLDVFSFARTQDGTISAVADAALTRDRRHHVPLFHAASALHTSRLRLINPGTAPASIRIQAWDDTGHFAPNGDVRLSLPAQATRTIDANDLQYGADGVDGTFGAGDGNWRLLVDADQDIHVMSLLTSTEGGLTNVSSTSIVPRFLIDCVGGSPDADDDGIADHCDEEPHAAIRPLSACGDGTYVVSPSSNPGLVGDCRVLIGFANYQAQNDSLSDDHAVQLWGFESQQRIDDWQGISVSGLQSRVTSIQLRGSEDPPTGLIGPIPPTLATLTGLTVLDLAYNQLSGPIPRELGQLINLSNLFLASNDLSGSIPAEIGRITNLRQLWLAENRLTGSIPPELGLLNRLTYLGLWSNKLSGPIPNEIGQLSRLIVLNLSDNQIGGPIPRQLSALTNLVSLYLHRNLLTGHIPIELGRLSRLEHLSMGFNRLTGPLPPELGQLSQLAELWLYGNDLTGQIPPEFGALSSLEILQLGSNRLSGSIPPQLATLTELRTLGLSSNRLTGVIPPELGQLNDLESFSANNNRLTGTVPWELWERSLSGQLSLYYSNNSIRGVASPPRRSRPAFSADPLQNGNASHHSVSFYQGPLTWEWNWDDDPIQHQRPLLGRWAALAVRIDHETPTPPIVATRVLDSRNTILAGRLSEAAPPLTESTGERQWRTEYIFDLPGTLYQAGNQVVHVIDPDNDLAETNENDNVGAPIRLYGERPPHFRITFVPFYPSGEETPTIDPASLMSGTLAYLPISDDYQATIAWPRQSNAANKFDLLDEVTALWNAEADADEFYHGIYVGPWPGTASRSARVGGVANRPGRIGVSELSPHSTIPHEIGHNLNLQHPPGCDAEKVDHDYPYPDGHLGPEPGWDVNWRRFASDADERITDVMSYCGNEHLISDYHYRKATNYWLGTSTSTRALGAQYQFRSLSAQGAQSSNQSPPTSGQPTQGSGALALSGRIDSSGTWSLTHAQATEKPPRSPPPGGEFTLILFDAGGTELFREQLAPATLSHGNEGGWAARTPLTHPAPNQVVILNQQRVPVLRAEISIR